MGSGAIYTVVSNDTDGHCGPTAGGHRSGRHGIPGSRAAPLSEAEQAPLSAAPPRRPPGDRPGRRRSRPGSAPPPGEPVTTDPRTYDKVEAIERWMSTHVRYTTDIPPLAGRGRRRDLLPVRHPARLLRADLHRHGGHAAVASASPPGRRSATCPGPTTRSPTSTTSRPRTPTPGCRSGSPATAGRTSTPRPHVPLANPAPGSVLARLPGHALGRLPVDPLGSPWSWCAAVVAVLVWLRRRRRRRPATWAHQVAADLASAGAHDSACPGGPTRP